MKKIVTLLSFVLLISACSNDRNVAFISVQNAPQQPGCACMQKAPVAPKPCVVQKPVMISNPCVKHQPAQVSNPCAQPRVVEPKCTQIKVDPCACSYRPDPCRQVLRPRLEETVAPKPRRQCPPDSQRLNCGCGQCQTFQNAQPLNDVSRKIVPAAPDAYVLASNRVFNRFIKDTYNVYSQKPDMKIYFKEPVLQSKDLPAGVQSGIQNMKRQLRATYTYQLTETPSEADYVVETQTDWFDTPTKTVPAIVYKAKMYDKNNNLIYQWDEVVKKADQSQNWI